MKIILKGAVKQSGYGNVFDMSRIQQSQLSDLSLKCYEGEKEQKEWIEITIHKSQGEGISAQDKTTIVNAKELFKAVSLLSPLSEKEEE